MTHSHQSKAVAKKQWAKETNRVLDNYIDIHVCYVLLKSHDHVQAFYIMLVGAVPFATQF
jgi:hypothetical protein